MTIKVFGHKSPDTDSTGSPLIWAWYLSEVRGTPAEARGIAKAAAKVKPRPVVFVSSRGLGFDALGRRVRAWWRTASGRPLGLLS